MFLPSLVNIIVPNSSVLYILIFSLFNLSIVFVAGWEYILFFPTDIIAYLGFTLLRKLSVVEYLEPWWPSFKTSADMSLFNIFFSVIFVASPVNK